MRTAAKASHREALLLQDRQAMQDQIAEAACAARSGTAPGERAGGGGGGVDADAGGGEAAMEAMTVTAELAALQRCNAAELRDARNLRAAAEAEAEVAREQVPPLLGSPHLPCTASACTATSASNNPSKHRVQPLRRRRPYHPYHFPPS